MIKDKLKQYIEDNFFNSKNVFDSNKLRSKNYLDKIHFIIEEAKKLNINSNNIKEIYYLTFNEKTYCKICNKETEFIRPSEGYKETCSKECSKKLRILKSKKTKLNKYGNENYNNPNKSKETKRNFSKDKWKNINDKLNKTLLDKNNSISRHYKYKNMENFNKEFIDNNFLIDDKLNINEVLNYFNIGLVSLQQLYIDEPEKLKNINRPELEIYNFLKELNINVELRNRKIIYPYELDFYLPDYNLAIEFDGLLYHSIGKSKTERLNNYEKENILKDYHLLKTKLCEDKDIHLLHIFENEWNDKKDIWKSVILNKLNKNKRLFARKCYIKEIDSNIKDLFLNKYHLQGTSISKINLGLFYRNDLVSVMTFGKSRYNKKYEYELLRLYHKIGFELINEANPNYFYFKLNRDIKLLSRIGFQKHKLKDKLNIFDNNLTESENMYNNDYRKIYDCGNLVFVKNY